jgi:predicted dehydrogenase
VTVRLAAVGLGELGRIELEVYDRMEGVEVVAGADVSADAREACSASFDVPTYASYETLLAEHGDGLDAAHVVTPHTLHHEHATACFDRGLDVFVEKPLVTDVADAVDLVETADERDCRLVVGYQRHFDPVYRRMRALVDDDEVGTVHQVNCFLGQDWIRKFADAWRADPALSGGGQLYDSGSHLLDTLLWTTGTEPVSVSAQVDRRGHEVDVNSALALRLDRGGDPVTASVAVTADGVCDPGTYEGLTVWGTDGRLAFDGTSLSLTRRGGETVRFDVETIGFREGLRQKLGDFVAAVRREKEPAVPGTFGLRVVALTEAAYEAAERGETVAVPSPLD